MLFNSYEFLFLFLPTTLAVFFALSGATRTKMAAIWLVVVSIFFYGYWSPPYVVLLLASMASNFAFGLLLLQSRRTGRSARARAFLIVAITANLLTLGYFKYANFFVNSFNSLTHLGAYLPPILLPIGISFFTFTQIAFLVDTYFGKVSEPEAVSYTLFVSFFPHLIAGPVLHHAEMMPQFARKETYRFHLDNFFVGFVFLAIGLFKKVVLADGIQPFVGPVFDASPGSPLTAFDAWGGVLAYTLQLYFDFSGYSDMAIGLAKMFNIDLPLNFNSPYKAVNIADFWRRWHMTLSRFLRDYLYIPLGGNRRGRTRRQFNLMVTMLLGGLWHGAGWTFVIWGGLHGAYLIIHQLWDAARRRLLGIATVPPSAVVRIVSALMTFLCVVVAWVFFRATSLDAALRVLSGMFGLNGPMWAFGGPDDAGPQATSFLLFPRSFETAEALRQWGWITALLGIAWLGPNSQNFVAFMRDRDFLPRSQQWSWMALGVLVAFIFLLAAISGSRGSSEFIYFNF